MNQKIPDRLIKEPLLEVIWEIRFSGAISPVSDLLPGMIFNSFPEKYDRVTRLPVSDIPTPVAENDPNLRYAPKIRFERGNGAIQIGDRVLSISCRRPYSGWKQFSHDIKRLSKIVQETGLVKCLERFSLKYIDLIELEKEGKSTFQVTRIFPSRWKTVFIPRTDLGRRLYALRNKAIVSGMKLLSEEEILEEIKYRRGEIEEKESNLH